MKKQRDIIIERLQSVMLSDRGNGADKLLISLKSDITDLLKSYMYTDGERVSVSLDVSGDGDYRLSVTARADRLIDIGKMID